LRADCRVAINQEQQQVAPLKFPLALELSVGMTLLFILERCGGRSEQQIRRFAQDDNFS